MSEVVDPRHLAEWVEDFGPRIGLDTASTRPESLPACWPEHPAAVHEVTGLFLAWTHLVAVFTQPGPEDDLEALTAVIPAPRDWLDLANATAPAVARAIAACGTCGRGGRHLPATLAASR